jgi:peroxiredoxin
MTRARLRRVWLLGAVTMMACSSGDRPAAAAFRPLAVGDRAPAYAVRSLAGDTLRVGAGAPVLLNVWATWCTSCREEMADLSALEKKYESHGVKVMAVSVDAGDGTRVKRFAEAEGLHFAIGHDPAGEVQRSFQAVGVPETYLVAGDGTLLWVRRGGLHDAGDSVRVALDQAVARLK